MAAPTMPMTTMPTTAQIQAAPLVLAAGGAVATVVGGAAEVEVEGDDEVAALARKATTCWAAGATR